MALRAVFTAFWVAVLLPMPSAQAIVLVGGGMLGLSQPEDNAESEYTSEFDFGAMLGWQKPMGRFRLELDVAYHRRSFSVGDYTAGMQYIELPPVIWFAINPAISIGLGGFAAYGLGSISQTQISTETSSSISYDDASLSSLTAGAQGALRIYMMPSSEKSLFIEGRYFYGLLNHATVGSFQHRDIVLLLGIRLGKG